MTRRQQATAAACSNIAFIKYWGNADHRLRLAASPSLSMNLADLTVTASVTFDPARNGDRLTINGAPATGAAARRVFDHLDLIRAKAGIFHRAVVRTKSNIPAGTGAASSAAAFAALAVAGAAAAGLRLSQGELSALARRGSGSACRSVPGGYCRWLAGGTDETSFGASIAPADHWDLCDIVAVVSIRHKHVGSSGGHALAETSSLQAARLAGAPARFEACKQALLNKDLAALGPIIEQDAILMHSVMMTSRPPLYYWLPATLEIIHAVQNWRAGGLPVYFTIDAGPNVHLICESRYAGQVAARARALPGVQKILRSGVGGPARLLAGGD
ncbi:MAG: diphosphomevalonate decarboxylase [Anaerolineae bacterium]